MTDTDSGVDQETVRVPPISEPEIRPTPTVARERVFVGTGLFWGLVVGVLLAIGVVILAAQNTGRTTIAFLGWEFSTPLIVVILGTLLVGVIFDELFGLVYRARRRRTMSDRDQLKRIDRSAANPE
ncbi:MAG TPA: lipopolysaccharide assembly protein LapA domain-containing protein [Acidimicrobiia bacterium]